MILSEFRDIVYPNGQSEDRTEEVNEEWPPETKRLKSGHETYDKHQRP